MSSHHVVSPMMIVNLCANSMFCFHVTTCSYGVAAAPSGQGEVRNTDVTEGEGSVYGNAAKRRKTTAEKKAAAEKKAQLQQVAEAEKESGEAYSIKNFLPWADKELAVSGGGKGGLGEEMTMWGLAL